jgi:hypothetical protein
MAEKLSIIFLHLRAELRDQCVTAKQRKKGDPKNPVTDAIANAGPVQTEVVETPATKQANAKAKGNDKTQAEPSNTKPAVKGNTKSAKNAKPAKKANDAKHAKATKKAAAPAKKAAKTGERSNKKAEVMAMMERAKGATLAEIMEVVSFVLR